MVALTCALCSQAWRGLTRPNTENLPYEGRLNCLHLCCSLLKCLVRLQKVRRKVGRPVMDHGNPFSAEVTPEQRRGILRRVANRESARRVRNRRNEELERLIQKVSPMVLQKAVMHTQDFNRAATMSQQLPCYEYTVPSIHFLDYTSLLP